MHSILSSALLLAAIFEQTAACNVTLQTWQSSPFCKGDANVRNINADGSCRHEDGEFYRAFIANDVLSITYFEEKNCSLEWVSAEATEVVRQKCTDLGGLSVAASWDESLSCATKLTPEIRSKANDFVNKSTAGRAGRAQLTGSPASGLGVDVSQPTSQDAFSCMNIDFVVVRAWTEDNYFDPSAPGTIAAAQAAGITDIDVYMFPCPPTSCSDGGGQLKNLVGQLNSNGISYGTIWLDIEDASIWSDQGTNVGFIQDILNAGSSLGVNLGVYTSNSQWGPITGGSTVASGVPLWYADWDDNTDFNDFEPFGGWNQPTMKQYQGNVNTCGANVDTNFK